MKIISTPLSDRYDGIINASAEVFDKVVLWEPHAKPMFDLFDEVKPDVVYCDIKYVTKSFMSACKQYEDVKLVLFAEGIPRDFEPDLVCAQPNLSPMLKKHLELGGHKVEYIHDYADIIMYWTGEADDTIASDIAFVSNGDMASSPVQKIELFSTVGRLGQLKIAGSSRIPIPQYIGTIKDDRIVSFLKSTKIAIDWNGENLLTCAANGIFTMSTIPNDLFPHITVDNAAEIIPKTLKNGKFMRRTSRKAQQQVLRSGTCYHRLMQITSALELDEYTKKAQSLLDSKLEEVRPCKQA